jgi:hypothetical protein
MEKRNQVVMKHFLMSLQEKLERRHLAGESFQCLKLRRLEASAPDPTTSFRKSHLLFFMLLVFAVAGCTTKAQARRDAQAAFLAGQKSVLSRQAYGVTVIGPVMNPNVPWVAGLTLVQAIATANYLDARDPKSITITRQGESASIDPKDLANGTVVPLEPGDVIEIR